MNAGSNTIIRDLIQRMNALGLGELETLMDGGTIEKAIRENIAYENLSIDLDYLWNFLYFTGYLTKVSKQLVYHEIYVTMQIPNKEIGYIYENHLVQWTNEQISKMNLEPFHQATITGNAVAVEQIINEVLIHTIRFYDGIGQSTAESFYYGVLLELYRNRKEYLLIFNEEGGTGSPALIIKHPSVQGKAAILEFKVTRVPNKLEEAAQKALEQIEVQDYKADLLAEGYTDITSYGVGFCKKCCAVVKG